MVLASVPMASALNVQALALALRAALTIFGLALRTYGLGLELSRLWPWP